MSKELNRTESDASRLFSEYGELVLLLEAEPAILKEVILDSTQEQKRKIIQVIEDQLNDTLIDGNEELFKRHLFIWMYTIRQLDTDQEQFMLNFTEWEYSQFY